MNESSITHLSIASKVFPPQASYPLTINPPFLFFILLITVFVMNLSLLKKGTIRNDNIIRKTFPHPIDQTFDANLPF